MKALAVTFLLRTSLCLHGSGLKRETSNVNVMKHKTVEAFTPLRGFSTERIRLVSTLVAVIWWQCLLPFSFTITFLPSVVPLHLHIYSTDYPAEAIEVVRSSAQSKKSNFFTACLDLMADTEKWYFSHSIGQSIFYIQYLKVSLCCSNSLSLARTVGSNLHVLATL